MAQNQWALPDGFDDTVKKALSVLFKALKNAKKAIPPAALEAVRMGDWESFQRLMNWNGIEDSFDVFKTILSDQAKAAAVQFYKDGGVGSKLTFDLIDERAVFFAQTRAAQLVTEITEEMRGNIRTIITSATLGEKTWQQAAEEINASLPLTSRDVAAVEKYRVRQFERFMKKGMTEASARTKANSMRDAYAEKLTQSRAATIARTEIATAASEGRYLGWEAGVQSGMVDNASVKEWIAEPSACDICQPMDGKTIPWDDEFPAGMMMPPAHPNCRCSAAILPPDYADSVFTNQAMIKGKSNQFEIEFAKHLAGKHNQDTHAGGKGRAYASIDDVIADAENLAKERMAALSGKNISNVGDALHVAIAQKLGLDGKPEIVDSIDDLDGEPMYRGLAPNAAGKPAQTMAEEYAFADVPRIGVGTFGSGIYFAETKEFTRQYSNNGVTLVAGWKKGAKIYEFPSEEAVFEKASSFFNDAMLRSIRNNPDGRGEDVLAFSEMRTMKNDWIPIQLMADGYDGYTLPYLQSGVTTKVTVVLNREALQVVNPTS